MPEMVMLPQDSSVPEQTDVTNQIHDLKELMNVADLMPDGFSDSESSSVETQLSQPVHKCSNETSQTDKQLVQTLRRKNGLFERHTPVKLYKHKKAKHSQQHSNRPKSSGTIKSERHRTQSKTNSSHDQSKDDYSCYENGDPSENKKKLNTEENESEKKSTESDLVQHEPGHHKHNGHKHHYKKHYDTTKRHEKPNDNDQTNETNSEYIENGSMKHQNHHHHVKKHHEAMRHPEKPHGSEHQQDHSSHSRYHQHGKHHHHSHGKSHHERDHVEARETGSHVIAVYDSKELTLFDAELFKPIVAGQSESDLDVPIMTMPAEQPINDIFRCDSARSTYYIRPMSFNFLLAGEKLVCTFDKLINVAKSAELLRNSEKDGSTGCFCSSSNLLDDTFCGWEAQAKGSRSKLGRRKKFNKPHSSDLTSHRLPQTMGKDPVIFHHYTDHKKYIERYRFYHTVGNVGRPLSYSRYEKGMDSDPYLSKVKTNLSSAIASPFYGIAQLMDEKLGSASSGGSMPDRLRDDDSVEGSNAEIRPYSMRDRGKALNLAPVRECTVPNLRPAEKIDIIQLNQYLNLTTPPVPASYHQFDIDDPKSKRFGHRTGNPVDSNTMLATSGSRRGGRTLRLGSAEFVKPGTPESEVRWSNEKRTLHRSSTVVASTIQGNLIVGSTISSPVPSATRARSGGKLPPYVQFQRDNIHKPPSPPQHVAGQRLKACDRVAELTGKESGKFGYTHAAQNERPAPVIRTATAVDFKETYIPHSRSHTITLDINHLGIRGQPFKQKEPMVVYKNRRAQATRS